MGWIEQFLREARHIIIALAVFTNVVLYLGVVQEIAQGTWEKAGTLSFRAIVLVMLCAILAHHCEE